MLRIFAFSLLLHRALAFLLNDRPLEVYLTSEDKSKQLSVEPVLHDGSGSGTRIFINRNSRYQTMDGFGAALTNSAAYVIYHSPRRHDIMRSLFGWSGISISFIRIAMGASDFQAVNPYTYDDTPNDFNLDHFSIAKDKDFIIPIIKEALSLNPKLKILASPRSAPAWMKYTNNLFGGYFNWGTEYQKAYALYFVKFIQAYAAEGIMIDSITLQNEPLWLANDYPTMGMAWEFERDFVKNHLGPKFRSLGITTKILIYDHNWDREDYPERVMNDSAAAQYIDGTAWHCYQGRHDVPNDFHQKFPSKSNYLTECTGGDWDTDLQSDIGWAFRVLMIGQPLNWAKGVILWNLALDDNHGPQQGVKGCHGCRGVVMVHTDGSFTKNVEYYNIGQMSKIVQPGAVRIDTPSLGWFALNSVAFENPDRSVAVTVLNPNDHPEQFYLEIDGKTYPFTLKERSIVSFLKRN